MNRGVQSGQLLFDELIIDFSPCRTKNLSEVASFCINTINSSSSLINFSDSSNVDNLGWQNTDAMLQEEG